MVTADVKITATDSIMGATIVSHMATKICVGTTSHENYFCNILPLLM